MRDVPIGGDRCFMQSPFQESLTSLSVLHASLWNENGQCCMISTTCLRSQLTTYNQLFSFWAPFLTPSKGRSILVRDPDMFLHQPPAARLSRKIRRRMGLRQIGISIRVLPACHQNVKSDLAGCVVHSICCCLSIPCRN